jgi:type I restriction enzyme, S subunit
MSFPRYPEYKDSGVEWLGQVPGHWDVLPCRAIVQERTAKNEGAECEDYLSLMANVGILPYAEKGDVGNKKPEDLSKCKIVTAGDLVINSMNYGIGSYGLSAYSGVCSSVYIVMTPMNHVVESRFAFRIFENKAFQTFAQSFGNGILEHRCAINWDILKPIGVPVPPQSEQRAILAFLDRETAKIDALVAEQHRLMELLKVKRQVVVSHAVTKGLNPHVRLKSSGIECIGDVPEHWVIIALKRIADVQTGVAKGKDNGSRNTISVPYLRVANVQDGYLDLEKVATMDIPVEDLPRYALKSGDVLMNEGGDFDKLGRGHVWEGQIDPCITQNHVFAVRPRNVESAWLNAITGSDFAQFYFMTRSKQSTNLASISSTNLMELPVLMPPKTEQQEILTFIANQTQSFDALTAEAQRAIDLMQERRTALISAAVTGRIDVRAVTVARVS